MPNPNKEPQTPPDANALPPLDLGRVSPTQNTNPNSPTSQTSSPKDDSWTEFQEETNASGPIPFVIEELSPSPESHSPNSSSSFSAFSPLSSRRVNFLGSFSEDREKKTKSASHSPPPSIHFTTKKERSRDGHTSPPKNSSSPRDWISKLFFNKKESPRTAPEQPVKSISSTPTSTSKPSIKKTYPLTLDPNELIDRAKDPEVWRRTLVHAHMDKHHSTLR